MEILNIGASAINKPPHFLKKTHLAWNETPTTARQNWRSLQMCFLFALVDVHIAEGWLNTNLRLRFLVHHSDERKRYMHRLSRWCHRPEFEGDRQLGNQKDTEKVNWGYLQVLQRSCGSSCHRVPWLGLTSLPWGRLERNHLLKVSLWRNNCVYLCCPSVVSLNVQMYHPHSFVIPGYLCVVKCFVRWYIYQCKEVCQTGWWIPGLIHL